MTLYIDYVLTLAVQVMLSCEIITALGGPVVPANDGEYKEEGQVRIERGYVVTSFA